MHASLFPDLVVNGETVPHAVVAAEAQNHTAPKGKPGIAWRKAANAVAMRTLLLQEARRRGLTEERVEVGPGRFETDEEALIRGLLESAVTVAPPTEDQIRAEWSRDPSRFRAPPLWEVSHILCQCDPRDEVARQRAHDLALGFIDQLTEKPGDFARIAAQNSDCGSRASGGSLGQLGPGDTEPEFEAALRSLAEGQVTPAPILTRHGYHVVRMDALAVGQTLPFEVVQKKIGEAIEKVAWSKAARQFANDLLKNASVSGSDLKPL